MNSFTKIPVMASQGHQLPILRRKQTSMWSLRLLICLLLLNFHPFAANAGVYCTPFFPGPGCSFGCCINTFKLTGESGTAMNDLSTGCGPANYTDSSAGGIVIMKQGTFYTANVNGFATPECVQIFIDFNDDFSFGSGETVGGSNGIAFDPALTPISIAIPGTAAVGNHRMRVVCTNTLIFPTVSPCSAGYMQGEVHDYTINIISSAVCGAVTGLTAGSITSTGANISWTAVTGSIGYEYVVDMTSTAPTGSGTATTSTSYSATGLTPSTTYYAHVRNNCGSGSFSSWTTISFTTAACAAVTGLAAGSITLTGANISWTAVTGSSGYEYVIDMVSTDPTGSGTATTSTSYSATGLTPATTYYAHVRNNCGGSSYGAWTTISFNTLTCSTITGLTAGSLTTSGANISWTAVTGSSGYEYVIDMSSSAPSGSGTATTATSYSATGLSSSTTYYAHVRNNCGSGSYSAWSTISFTTLTPPCSTVTGLTAGSITSTSANISWTAVTGSSGYEYVIDMISTAPAGSGTFTTATSYSATSLSSSTTYYAHVRNYCGGSSFSAWTTIPFTTLVGVCNPVTSLVASSITSTSATISWSSITRSKGYEYVIDMSPADPIGAGTATPSTSKGLTGLSLGTTYYAHVRNNCGSGSFSSWSVISFTTASTSPCGAISGLTTGGITMTTANISWAAVTDATGYEYIVDMSSTAPIGPGTATTLTNYTPTGLTPATTYFAHVRSACGSGSFSPWVTVTFTTASTFVCSPVAGLTASSIKNTNAAFHWTSVSGSTGYQYIVNTSSFDPAGPGLTATGTNANQSGLSPATLYYIHVRNNCGSGILSSWVSKPFTTLTSTGLINIAEGDFNITTFPNPVKDEVTISVQGAISNDAQVQLNDITGKLIKTVKVNANLLTISMNGLPPGMYLIKYIDAEHTRSIRITKQ